MDHYEYELSGTIADIIGAEPLRCWRNAALAVMLLPELFAFGRYVEGWIVIPREKRIEIVEHGWCTLPNRSIVDPSILLIEKRDQHISYIPGYVLSRGMLSCLLPGSTLPLICHTHYGDDGMRHKGYQQAYHNAWQQALDLAQEKELSQAAIAVRTRDRRQGVTVVTQWGVLSQ